MALNSRIFMTLNKARNMKPLELIINQFFNTPHAKTHFLRKIAHLQSCEKG